MSDHRWSGWPGAVCLDCFAEDLREYCIAIHFSLCPQCNGSGEVETVSCGFCCGTGMGVCDKPECQNPSCLGCPTCHQTGFGAYEPCETCGRDPSNPSNQIDWTRDDWTKAQNHE